VCFSVFQAEVNLVSSVFSFTSLFRRERTSKENAQRDLEILNDQQKLLKDRIADLDVKCKKDGDRAELLERDAKEARDKKEEAEVGKTWLHILGRFWPAFCPWVRVQC